MYFQGTKCKKCGNDKRYLSSRGCVGCTSLRLGGRQKQASINRESAKLAGKLTYQGRPCKACGNTSRLVSTGDCLVCKKVYKAKRRSSELHATPVWSELDMIRTLYEASAYLTLLTGVKWNVDHEVPLKHKLVSGLHVYANLQLLTYHDNMSKGNRFDVKLEPPG